MPGHATVVADLLVGVRLVWDLGEILPGSHGVHGVQDLLTVVQELSELVEVVVSC